MIKLKIFRFIQIDFHFRATVLLKSRHENNIAELLDIDIQHSINTCIPFPYIAYVTRYAKTDYLWFFMKIAFWVWIDVEFTVVFNGQRARL